MLLASVYMTRAWGACPETLTLAEMVDCFGVQEAEGEGKGASPDPPEARGREDMPLPAPEDPGPKTDVDC